jgi:N-acetylornithine carbamoyltransferase
MLAGAKQSVAALPEAVAAALSRVPAWTAAAPEVSADTRGAGLPHFMTGLEPGRDGTLALLDLADSIRAQHIELARARPLAGRVFAGMFFDPSLRTRTSFHVACCKLGVEFMELEPGSGMWTLEFAEEVVMDGLAQEHVREAAGVLGRYADILGLRAFPQRGKWETERSQPIHRAFADFAGVPVVNLEGPWAHPCQGLADALTLRDLFPEPRGRKFVLSWAPHPKQLPMAVPNSALWAAAAVGMDVTLAHPEGFELDPESVEAARGLAAEAGGHFSVTHDRGAAFDGADVVYAKSWGAIRGMEATAGGHADAVNALRDWTVRESDLRRGGPARFMHCLPVRRNVVVAGEVLDGPLSVVLDQAENRVWGQAALLLALLGRA